ncbi:MAG: TetR/AcrR family transcriptional regulator [Wohlfahrtiimonas sp.]
MDKQQQLILTAFNLFYNYGVNATGINTILMESGIAKKTLYNHFNSKTELIIATLKWRDQQYYSWLETRLNNVKESKSVLHEVFLALDDWFNNRIPELHRFHGCYFINVAAEFKEPSDPIYQLCAQHKQRINQLIEKYVYQFTNDPKKAKLLIATIMTLKEGAIVQAHVLSDKNAAQKAQMILEQLLKS